jgi:hypothetical protein
MLNCKFENLIKCSTCRTCGENYSHAYIEPILEGAQVTLENPVYDTHLVFIYLKNAGMENSKDLLWTEN